MNAIAKAYEELRLPTMPEVMVGTQIYVEDVYMVYVLNPAKTGGEVMRPSQLYTMPIEEVGGWYEIKRSDVTEVSLATADD